MTSEGNSAGLRVTLVQRASSLQPADNRAALEALGRDLSDPTAAELVVLPEAFARDFGSPGEDISDFAEGLDGEFVAAVDRLAGPRRTVVAGMFERSEDPSRPFNTLVVRGGATASYRKIHLYDSFGYRESDRLSAGEWQPTVVDINGFAVGLMTCYDLRFPELARDLVAAGADALLVPAAWVPGRTEADHARKIDHWQTLLRSRAIENTVYVIGVGQAAPRYTGHSLAIGPLGETLLDLGTDEGMGSVMLDHDQIARARDLNPSLANRRRDRAPR